jgi:prepilin-type N-terminal cleavage/methylation domain-containing protein
MEPDEGGMRLTRRPNPPRGFTLIEMAVVLAVVVVIAAMAGVSIVRNRPRATLASATTDLQGLIHSARQIALASGHDVVVMLFPLRTGAGPRVVLYEDAAFDLLTGGGAVDFDGYDVDKPAGPADSRQAFQVLDLPTELEVGPATGMGAAGPLPAPLAAIDVTKACSFCSADDTKNRRGAIRFDPRGMATFYSQDATQRPSGDGASFTLTNTVLGQRNTFVILTSTGAVQLERTE